MVSHRGPRRSLGRSVRLFRAFLVEQSAPDDFYRPLAEDSVAMVAEFSDLASALVVDVGAGPEQFARAFRHAGATYVPVDLDPTVASLADGGVAADAHALPLRDASVDVAFSSNLMEHVRHPDRVAAELVRVARPGGLVVISYTNWWSPWGGHETSPWHWFGGRRAWRRYERRHGHPPKNRVGVNMFPISVAWGMRWAAGRGDDIEVLAARPRYLPDWLDWLVRVPVLRELVTWNVVLLLRRR